MPFIYSSAYNVAIWLGAASVEDLSAVELIPKILNLRAFHTSLNNKRYVGPQSVKYLLRWKCMPLIPAMDTTAFYGFPHCSPLADMRISSRPTDDVLRSWVAFSRLLQRAWFQRRWVIQEVACAERLSIRIGRKILSWIDFADAVELFSAHFPRIEELYNASDLAQYDPDALRDTRSTGVLAIIDLSRKSFRRSADRNGLNRLMDLQSLVSAAAPFVATNIRDVVYALLYMGNDAPSCRIIVDYSRSVLNVYADFVDYCMLKESSLDVICRTWAHWPSYQSDEADTQCPSWVGLVPTSRGGQPGSPARKDGEQLVGKPSEQVYNSSRGIKMQANIQHEVHSEDADGVIETSLHANPSFSGVLIAKGFQIGKLSAVSSRVIEGTIAEDGLKVMGWKGSLDHGVPDRLWRTLVANRGPHGKTAPSWWRRACAVALTQSSVEGNLSTTRLLANRTQPSDIIEFLRRVQTVVSNRKFFRCKSGKGKKTVGFGPQTVMEGDIVCILFGCSVPVILRAVEKSSRERYRLIGECYVHDFMEGEPFDGMSQESIDQVSIDFHIQ